MDATALLTQDHRSVEKLFKRFEKTGARAYATKRQIVDRIIEELSVHAAIEEQVFYPAVRRRVAGAEDQALESLEEHHVVKWLLSELEGMAPDDERYTAKTTVLIENVRHHVTEEQDDLFPKVRRSLSRRELTELGDALARAKEQAPHRPHPRMADTPPVNLVVGPASAVVDRVTGGLKDAASAALEMVTGNAGTADPTLAGSAENAAATAKKTVDTAGREGRKAVKRTVKSAKATARSGKQTGRAAKTTGTTAVRQTKAAAKKTTQTAKRSAAAKRKGSTAAKSRPAAKTPKSARSTKAVAAKRSRSKAA